MTNKQHELKPCPMCNGKGDFFTHHPKNTKFDIAVVAQCTECGYERTASIFGNDYAIGNLDSLYDYVVEGWNEAWEAKNNDVAKTFDKIIALR